jgi:predicted DsbA family dithiol-disulfide isomerase
MIEGWGSYGDPVNAVYRPGQMGPLWMQAQHISGMPIDTRIWMEDRPSSSWPACIAVKAAELQSPRAADLYLRRLREAVMRERRNIAQRKVLIELAEQCADRHPGLLDTVRLQADLDSPAAREAFRDDVKEARYRRIGRFPALVVRRPRTSGTVLVGWRPFEALRSAVMETAPELGPGREAPDAECYRAFWPAAIQRELDEALAKPAGAAR